MLWFSQKVLPKIAQLVSKHFATCSTEYYNLDQLAKMRSTKPPFRLPLISTSKRKPYESLKK